MQSTAPVNLHQSISIKWHGMSECLADALTRSKTYF